MSKNLKLSDVRDATYDAINRMEADEYVSTIYKFVAESLGIDYTDEVEFDGLQKMVDEVLQQLEEDKFVDIDWRMGTFDIVPDVIGVK